MEITDFVELSNFEEVNIEGGATAYEWGYAIGHATAVVIMTFLPWV